MRDFSIAAAVSEAQVTNRLAELRTKRGISAAQLAASVGVSRQTVYAIEAGTYVPNTAVSLKLARVLDTSVEELFELQTSRATPAATLEVSVLTNPATVPEGQSLRLCRVGSHIVAVPPESGGLGLPPTDAVMAGPIKNASRTANARVQVVSENWREAERLLIAGCDPSAPILADAMRREGHELLVAYENSSRSVELLHQGLVHIAGTHSVELDQGTDGIAKVFSGFPRGALALFRYASWEEGLVVAVRNPKKIGGIEDLKRTGITIANREPGAACRILLDKLLKARKISPASVRGYNCIAFGQLPAARLVQNGEADCCISTQASAQALGLGFVPLVKKPYVLAVRRSHLELKAVQALLTILGRASFRREVQATTGYDMRQAGQQLR